MWQALRAELAYFRPWLLGGLGIAVGVAALLHVLLGLLGEGEGVPTFLPGMFPILAGMVVAFIAQSYRAEERRNRLLMAAPLIPRQLAGATVLLPVCFVGLGVLAAVLTIGATTLVTGKLEVGTLKMLGVLAGQFLIYAQLGPLVQEAVAAFGQGRIRPAIATWAGLVAAIPVLIAFYWLESQPAIYVAGYLILLVVIMAASMGLYQRRTDYTR